MDPTTLYHLGQIRQKELLDECLRDQMGDERTSLITSLWQGLRKVVAPRDVRPRTRQPVASVECSDTFATSH